jgi:hypothetical protein
LARSVARCTLPLPRAMTSDEVFDSVRSDLRSRVDVRAWKDSPWLADELVLDVDEDGNATVAGFDLHYDPNEGLRVTRADA